MYIWNSYKPRKAVHIINPITGKTFCKAEHGVFSKCKHLVKHETMPEKRRLCSICEHFSGRSVASKGKPSFNVKDFYQSREWHKLRYEAFQRYGRRCLVCGADYQDGARLHVDHIKPIRKFPELALEITNLQILCALCNSGKGSWDETDWRDPSEFEAHLDEQANTHMRDILQ